MRVLLVGPDYEANLSLLYLAASLRAAGHDPVIAPFNTSADAPSVLAQARGAGMVGLSMCFQVRALEFLDLAEALKAEEPDRPVIAGGHYASCAAADLLGRHPALDAIAVHEGEQTIVELAALGCELARRAGEVAGVAVRRDGQPWFSPPRPILSDLERLPRPDRSGPARLLCGVPTAYLMGSRGCVSACDYCCITTLHRMASGRRFRQRSPEDVAGEMAELYHRRGVRQFVFHDDNFLVPSYEHNRQRIGRLRAELDRRQVRDIGLVLKCSPRDADRRILETLREMGLLRIFMGIESGSACGLASIGRRQTVEQSERALQMCEELGISSQYTMIIFSPEATAASMLADLDFIGRHPGHPLNYCRAEIYAGTPLEARMLREGRAEGDYLGRVYRYTDPKVELVWDLGKDLFAGRCWGQDELLGKVIRMDHQIAVLDHFYEGKKVRELVRSFLSWETELNLETAGLFRELVVACAEAPDAADVSLAKAVDDLRRRETPSREERLRQACEYRKTLDRFSRASVESGKRYAAALDQGRRLRGPRHAAAVAVAIGVLGIRGVAEGQDLQAPPRPDNPRYDIGVAEAPPPPLHEPKVLPRLSRRDAGTADDGGMRKANGPRAEPPDAGIPGLGVQPNWRPDPGVAEAAPPPFPPPPPPPYQFDHGVAEAAPPPVRPRQQFFTTITTLPEVPVLWQGRTYEQPFRWNPIEGEPSSALIGNMVPGGDIAVALTPIRTTVRRLDIQVRSNLQGQLEVTFGDVKTSTPMTISLASGQTPPPLVLVDPRTAARLEIQFAP